VRLWGLLPVCKLCRCTSCLMLRDMVKTKWVNPWIWVDESTAVDGSWEKEEVPMGPSYQITYEGES